MPEPDSYLEAASRRFLEGTGFTSPAAAVAAGARTIEAWCEILQLARNACLARRPTLTAITLTLEDLPNPCTPQQFAAATGFPVARVYEYLKTGRIRHEHAGKRVLIDASEAVFYRAIAEAAQLEEAP